MQVYLHSTGKYLCHNKYFGRDLTDDSFIDTLQEFFKNNEFIRVDVIAQVISSLEEMIDVLSKLETYRFYTACLLVTYDGQVGTKEPLFDLRLIDFAHSTHRGLRDPVVHEGPDAGFIQGLKSLFTVEISWSCYSTLCPIIGILPRNEVIEYFLPIARFLGLSIYHYNKKLHTSILLYLSYLINDLW